MLEPIATPPLPDPPTKPRDLMEDVWRSCKRCELAMFGPDLKPEKGMLMRQKLLEDRQTKAEEREAARQKLLAAVGLTTLGGFITIAAKWISGH
jgi:hypothetical protein